MSVFRAFVPWLSTSDLILLGGAGVDTKHTVCLSVFFLRFGDVHLSMFISVFNQLDAQNLFYNKFYFMPHVEA